MTWCNPCQSSQCEGRKPCLSDARLRLGAAEAERDALREENARLKARDRQAMVRQFFHIANQAQPRTPAVPDDETVRFRLRLIAEEFFELLESGFDVWEAKEVDWALGHVIDIITHAKIKVDMAEMADALGDIEFTTNGMAIAFGVDTDPLWEAVSAANNSKAGGPVVNGKLMKPDGFEPPPIGALLEAQGWKP